ncbi:MAG: carboxypeptidase-like regulatory domain-containing protein, partial [Candidatus Bathyarchaeota archaeon]
MIRNTKFNVGTFLIYLMINSGIVFSQGIMGFITDAETGLPMANVNIVVKGTSIGTTSQDDGSYKITALALGEYTLESSMVGYKKAMVLVIVNADSLLRRDIELFPTVLQLQPIEVTAK